MQRRRARPCTASHAKTTTCENCFFCPQCNLSTFQKNCTAKAKQGILKCEDCKVLEPHVVPTYAVQQAPQSDEKKQTYDELHAIAISAQNAYTQICLDFEEFSECMNKEILNASKQKKAKDKAFAELQTRFRELEQMHASQQVDAKKAFEALQNRCNRAEIKNDRDNKVIHCFVVCLLLMSYCLLGVSLRCM